MTTEAPDAVVGVARAWIDELPRAPSLHASKPFREAAVGLAGWLWHVGDEVPVRTVDGTRAWLGTMVGTWRRLSLPDDALFEGLGRLGESVCAARLESLDDLDPAARLHRAGRILDATSSLVRRAVRTLRSWTLRSFRDEAEMLAFFGEALTHELHNRLAASETAVRLLLEPERVDDDERRRLEALMLEGFRAARRAVEDVREMMAAAGGTDGSRITDLPRLVREAVRQARVRAAERGLEIRLDDALPEADIDGARAELALRNLLSNAVDYHHAPVGGGWIEVRARLDDADSVSIEVADDGPGIDEALVEGLFDRGVDDAVGSTGSGLGLWLTRTAVEQIGGDVVYEARPGGGSVFRIRLPVAHPPVDEA